MACRPADQNSVLDGSKAWLAVFSFTLFMVGRKGVETATMLASLASSAELGYMVWGGVIGLALAIAIAGAWVRMSSPSRRWSPASTTPGGTPPRKSWPRA